EAGRRRGGETVQRRLRQHIGIGLRRDLVAVAVVAVGDDVAVGIDGLGQLVRGIVDVPARFGRRICGEVQRGDLAGDVIRGVGAGVLGRDGAAILIGRYHAALGVVIVLGRLQRVVERVDQLSAVVID